MRASSLVSSSRDEAALRMYFIPFPTPGHALPMSDLARLFASRGADATLVLTRANAARFGGPLARAAAAGHRIRIHALTLPAEAAGLTGGHESADDLPNRELAGPVATAVDLLAPLFADLLRRHPADAVVFDGVLPWAATAAPELGIPRYAFTGTGCFALSVLRHAAVDAFVTHCGWGAVIEAAAAGVPVLAWPVFAEQFYNEALVVGLAGTGSPVGAERGYVWGGEAMGGVVVGREAVAARVRAVMPDEALRRRAGEVGERARRAVEAGGPSYEAVGALLEDVRRRRRRRQESGGTTARAALI